MEVLKKNEQKVAVCYLHPPGRNFIPLEIGYFLAKKSDYKKRINFKIITLFSNGAEIKRDVNQFARNTDLILKEKCDAVFFFLDNELWTGFFPLVYLLKIVKRIRRKNKNIFIGFVSKRKDEEIFALIFKDHLVDCFIENELDGGSSMVSSILKKEIIEGVIYRNDYLDQPSRIAENFKNNSAQSFCDKDKNYFVDKNIQSPYLLNILKPFLFEIKKDEREKFLCPIFSSRGCKFGCHYCFRSVKFKKISLFSPKRFFDEIEYLVGLGFFNFFVADDVFSLEKKRLKSLVLEFQKRRRRNESIGKISFYIMTRIEEFEDEEGVRLLKVLNVKRVQVGLQTINPKLDFLMKRGAGSTKRLIEIKQWLDRSLIKINIDIILGLPRDTVFYAKRTLDFALSIKPAHLQIKQLYLNPNTLLACEKDKHRIKTEELGKDDMGVPFVESSAGEVSPKYFKEVSDYYLVKMKKTRDVSYRITMKDLKKVSLI